MIEIDAAEGRMDTPPQKNNIISFGKYKGQPAEVLQADPSYCAWLQGQSWFTERYPQINTLIINNFTPAEDTPIHNALQARFLDESLSAALCDTLLRITNEPYRDGLKELYLRKYANCIEKQKSKKNEQMSCWNTASESCFCAKASKKESEIIIEDTEFEESGWDVRVNAKVINGDPEKLSDLPIKVFIEIKPGIGDDYPSVLRQIKGNIAGSKSIYALVYNEFTAIGVTLEQVRRIFRQSNIYMISFAELDMLQSGEY